MARRVQRRQPALLSSATYGLPRDLAIDALERLGWLSLCLAIAVAGIYIAGGALKSGWIDPSRAPASYRISMWSAVALSLAMFLLIRAKALSEQVLLDISLIYEVITALCIAVAENSVPYLESEVVRGASAVAVWIVLFALAVPASFGKALLASLTTACMGPLGLAIQILLGNLAMPKASMWMVLFSTDFLMAVGAALLGKLIYRLGAQVEEARAMGSYQLVEMLGSGGMGEVWLARHRMLAKQAAIKLVKADMLARGGAVASAAVKRFEREAAAIAGLHSPHTVTLYDYGVTDDGRFYYVMELLNGLDLEALVQRHGPAPAARAAHILEQMCDALAEAHSRGLIHRDVKPRNVLLCKLGYRFDFVKVLDFGLVKFDRGEESRLTGEGQAAGTPAFMAPEAAMGKPNVDLRADLYGVGCIAYWLLTGELVFQESTAAAMMIAHVQQAPEPPSQRTDNVIPAEFESLIMKCLAKKPEDRPQSARELGAKLRAMRGNDAWTMERAEEWWRLHLPEGAAPVEGQTR